MAHSRHKRDTDARLLFSRVTAAARLPRRAALVAAPIATITTLGLVGVGVVAAPGPASDLTASIGLSQVAQADASEPELSEPIVRDAIVSRMAPRVTAAEREHKRTLRAVRAADTRLWTTTELNVWPASTGERNRITVLDSGKRILVTGRARDGRTEIVLGGESRWVTTGYLSDEKPEPETTEAAGGGIPAVGGACTNGTSVSGGANVVAVHRAVCAAFPQIRSYGTWRAGATDHSSGRAVDIMVSGALGWDIANFVRANYRALGVSYVIYAQRIWSVDRAGEGWRPMSDRGSATANHYDHVHVSTY